MHGPCVVLSDSTKILPEITFTSHIFPHATATYHFSTLTSVVLVSLPPHKLVCPPIRRNGKTGNVQKRVGVNVVGVGKQWISNIVCVCVCVCVFVSVSVFVPQSDGMQIAWAVWVVCDLSGSTIFSHYLINAMTSAPPPKKKSYWT